jgi:hypothetical protein
MSAKASRCSVSDRDRGDLRAFAAGQELTSVRGEVSRAAAARAAPRRWPAQSVSGHPHLALCGCCAQRGGTERGDAVDIAGHLAQHEHAALALERVGEAALQPWKDEVDGAEQLVAQREPSGMLALPMRHPSLQLASAVACGCAGCPPPCTGAPIQGPRQTLTVTPCLRYGRTTADGPQVLVLLARPRRRSPRPRACCRRAR